MLWGRKGLGAGRGMQHGASARPGGRFRSHGQWGSCCKRPHCAATWRLPPLTAPGRPCTHTGFQLNQLLAVIPPVPAVIVRVERVCAVFPWLWKGKKTIKVARVGTPLTQRLPHPSSAPKASGDLAPQDQRLIIRSYTINVRGNIAILLLIY